MASDHSLILTGELSSSTTTSTRSHRKKLIFTITSLFTLFLVVVAAAIAIATTTANHHKRIAASHALIRTSCSSTLYPDLCYSSLCSNPSHLPSLTDHKSVILSSIDLSVKALHHIRDKFQSLYQPSKLTARESAAIHDCLEMFDDTLDELRASKAELRLYAGNNKATLLRYASDLKTLVSAAMTNQQSCLDGFSHDAVCRKLRKSVKGGVDHIEKMCSNSLAMIKNLTDGDLTSVEGSAASFVMAEDGFPEWMSEEDKSLLKEGDEAKGVEADVTVAKDGSGDFRTVTEAVEAAPEKSKRRFVIKIKAGTYKENVEVSKKKTYIMFVGDGRKKTVITGRRNVVDGYTTFRSATVAVVGKGFLARDITFENTAGPSKHQAVALRVGSDFSAFYRCDVIAYQDTLYVHSLRQFFRDCLVRGTVDFIFGNAAVVLQSCDLQARRPNKGQKNMFTAQGRDDPNQNTGISIQGCTLSAAPDLKPVQGSVKSYLGRPWKRYSRTVIMKSTITKVVEPEGWHKWTGTFAQSTCYYAEYRNTGAGADTSKRVNWKGVKVIRNAGEASKFTPANFISGSSWLAATGFPFSLGL